MLRLRVVSCFVVLHPGVAESPQSPDCANDPGHEECTMPVNLLQGKMQLDSSDLGISNRMAAGATCKSWCATKVSNGVQTWDSICSWSQCNGCSDCPTTTTTVTTTTTTAWQSPFFMMTCSGTQIKTTPSMTFSQYDAAVASVQGLYNSLPSTCNADYCPQADFAGCVLRIAGHDFMDYKDGEGGSDACIDLHDADNGGLAECIYQGDHGVSIADAYADYCTTISLADFVVISAEAVMNVTRQHVLDDDATRSAVDFRSKFKWGRTTALSCSFAEGRLPNPEHSCTAVQTTFVDSMGLDWGQSAALMGVHTLGRADIANSGYNGWWSDALNSRKFNNNYFTSIVLKGWAPETSVNGNSGKNQWQRVDVGTDDTKEMMLNTDMCLYFTMDDAGAVEMDAATALASECNCTWATPVKLSDAVTNYNDGKFCGSTEMPGSEDFPRQRALCCGLEFDTASDQWVDCGLPLTAEGPAASYVQRFANNEDSWLSTFARAWNIATTNNDGVTRLRSLQD